MKEMWHLMGKFKVMYSVPVTVVGLNSKIVELRLC
jgi:hypothetical protein